MYTIIYIYIYNFFSFFFLGACIGYMSPTQSLFYFLSSDAFAGYLCKQSLYN